MAGKTDFEKKVVNEEVNEKSQNSENKITDLIRDKMIKVSALRGKIKSGGSSLRAKEKDGASPSEADPKEKESDSVKKLDSKESAAMVQAKIDAFLACPEPENVVLAPEENTKKLVTIPIENKKSIISAERETAKVTAANSDGKAKDRIPIPQELLEKSESVSYKNPNKSEVISRNKKKEREEKKAAKAKKIKAEKAEKAEKTGKTEKTGTAEKTGKKRRRMSLKAKILLSVFALIIVCAAAFGTWLAVFVATSSEKDVGNIYSHIDMSSFLYDSDGKEIDKLYYSEDRETVSISDIPDVTKNAFIAIEDKTFYEHHGFNLTRIIGAIFNKLTGRSEDISGTSTITQQLARNVFLAEVKSQRSIKRKISEMIYALELEHAMTKDEILEAYLNTIYLGYGCYGIESAARTYFGKDVQDLTLAESAALAALPQAPDSYALLRDEGKKKNKIKGTDVYANDSSRERRYLVLDLMAEQGYITPQKAEKAKKKIKKLLHPSFWERTGDFTYFSDYVSAQVTEDLANTYSISEEEADRLVHTGGLHIYSTVDSETQHILNEEFKNDYNFPYSAEKPQAAMVITDVKTGKIRAMSGGTDAKGQKLYNRAVNPRQPGSSIKPLAVYSAALQKSYEYAEDGETFPFINYGIDRQGVTGWGNYITAGSRVTDERLTINGEYWPQNFSRSFSGYKTFRTALQQSINTCAVKIQLQVGADYSIDLLKKYGISTLVDDKNLSVNDINPAALALGAMTYGCTPLDMSLAYATFPNGGVRNSAVSYTKVLDSEGNVILKKKTEKTKVLDEGVAWIMTDCLKSVVSRGIAGNASIYGVQVGGKTGTTNDTYDIWFCGFTPKYSAALWIGTDKNTAMSGTSTQAALLWSRIMRQIPDITEGTYKPQPYNVVYKWGEYYTDGTEPSRGYGYSIRGEDYSSYDESESTDEKSGKNSGDDASQTDGSSLDPDSDFSTRIQNDTETNEDEQTIGQWLNDWVE